MNPSSEETDALAGYEPTGETEEALFARLALNEVWDGPMRLIPVGQLEQLLLAAGQAGLAPVGIDLLYYTPGSRAEMHSTHDYSDLLGQHPHFQAFMAAALAAADALLVSLSQPTPDLYAEVTLLTEEEYTIARAPSGAYGLS